MPGSYVDVVAVIVPVAPNNNTQGPISKIVLQNIKVLASGPKIDSPPDQRQPSDVKAVTLQVTPGEAEKLVLAANEGKLQLVMRNYTDQEDSETTGANKASLLSGEPVKPNPGPPSETKPLVSKPKRAKVAASHVETKPLPVAPLPVARKSVELIEGSKRRDVDVP